MNRREFGKAALMPVVAGLAGLKPAVPSFYGLDIDIEFIRQAMRANVAAIGLVNSLHRSVMETTAIAMNVSNMNSSLARAARPSFKELLKAGGVVVSNEPG